MSRNLVCNGLADGVVIGQKGRGVIEGNTIKGTCTCKSQLILLRFLIPTYRRKTTGTFKYCSNDCLTDLCIGNVGCGIWVMGGQPLIQVNQIYNNNDTGVSFVQNKV